MPTWRLCYLCTWSGDVIARAKQTGGIEAAAQAQLRLLENEHLSDQLAARDWLMRQSFVDVHHVATAGNSFGGIQALLGGERGGYCAVVDAAGAADSWQESPRLRDRLLDAVRRISVPMFFFQASNDFDVRPSRELFAAARSRGLKAKLEIYPAFGTSNRDGHSFAYLGVDTWGQDVTTFLDCACLKAPDCDMNW